MSKIEKKYSKKSESEILESKIDSKDKLYPEENKPINLDQTEENIIITNDKNVSIFVYKKNNNTKNKKKVKFLEPNFVRIIEVESYKKFNEENTSKDPFDFAKQIEGKENVLCSCLVI